MKLLFAKARWEMEHLPLEPYLDAVARDRFDLADVHLPNVTDVPALVRGLRERQLGCLVQLASQAATPEAQAADLVAQVERALPIAPLFFNVHVGRDHFSQEANLRVIAAVRAAAARHGLATHFETHRARALFSLPATAALLAADPELTLTADFSHFTCVHESTLDDQPAAVAACLRAARHIHARVGFDQGPQVSDPFAPCFARWLARFVGWWSHVVEARAVAGAAFLTITPEAGPPPYMPVDPSTAAGLRDTWSVNVAMRDHLAALFRQYR